MKRQVIVIAAAVVLVLVAYFIVKGNRSAETSEIFISATTGRFEVNIETTGELEALNSTKILGPTRLRDFRIYSVPIESIVDEGTIVRKGDWVASLDRSEFESKLQDAQLEVDRMQSQYIQTQLDTALQMRQSRDELVNLDYAVQEREIELEQSQFEPPATQRQAQMNLEKAIRSFKQAKENYVIKEQQNQAKMAEVLTNLTKAQRDLQSMQSVVDKFTILAPEDGMVIYRKGFDGKQIKEGSTISAWDPAVAELPDLSVMISKTYVNEVDVRKIKTGQHVEMGLDAFPEKKLTGTVIRVANVGEQRPNSDAKVFQVSVRVHGNDDLLRPAMTTSNKIVTRVIDSAMFVPLEALHTMADSITYVYRRVGINTTKQEVIVGQTNSNEAVIEGGIEPSDRIYLNIPAGQEEKAVALLPEMDGKRSQPEPEVEEVEIPQERTITLPDGRTITVPADGSGRQRFRRGDGQGSRPQGQGSQQSSESQSSTSQSQ